MRPLKLTLSAFGPFVDAQEIDFSQAGGDGIFLITGETGAGKTTIFDGMSFALYGSASGDSRKPGAFKSDHAPLSALCEVEFSFSLRDKTYRVRRSPAQRGQKRDGSPKDIAPSAELTLPDGETVTGFNAVTARLEQILGLDYRQFKQTTMLAQGEFRRLIESDGRQKQEIFSKIFGTSVYSQLTERLLREEAALQREQQSIEDAVARCVHELAGYGHAALLDPAAHLWPYSRIEELVLDAVALHTAKSEQLDADIEALELKKQKLDPGAAAKMNEKLKRRDSLRSLQSELTTKEERILQDEKLLIRLKHAKGLFEQEKIILSTKDQSDAYNTQIAALEKELEALSRRETGAAAAASQGADAPQIRMLEQNRAALEADYSSLYRRFLDGQAALLSKNLRAGEACPVCGSAHHPAPAAAKTVPTTEKELEQAKKALEHASKQLAEALERLKDEHWQAQAAREKCAERLAATKSHRDNLSHQFEELRAKFIKALKEAGFLNYRDYAAALKETARITALENATADYRAKCASTAAQLAALEEDTAGHQSADIDALVHEADDVTKRLAALRDSKTELYALLSGSQRRLLELKRLHAEKAERAGKYAIAHELATLAKGNRTVSFERYILASYFDDVIKQANIHLQRMTSSRYRLRRRNDPDAMGSGLDMEIIDSYTGKPRDISTLSGGESFKTSLALALGLSGVVQIYAGGISIDTMFIDEGFGSLDERSLDAAVQTLISLKNSGHMVGVISHVPGLRGYIPKKLAVRYSPTGSTVEWL